MVAVQRLVLRGSCATWPSSRIAQIYYDNLLCAGAGQRWSRTSEIPLLHKLESRCVPLADATRYCAEAIEVANSAGSRSN
jgi:hypothetical protein